MKKTKINIISDEAKRFYEFRKAEDLTLTELAGIIGKDFTAISRYEKGERVIPMDVVKAMHERLGMDFNWFYMGKGNRKYVPVKGGLITDIKTLETNQSLLSTQVESLKKLVLSMSTDLYELKTKVG